MKILAIICEFNPFHNGHKYLIDRAREKSGCDAVLCIMSGCFTQRGEICRNDKFQRAAHAILNGADAVIELPPSFAVAPAEIFARGAIKILSAVPCISCLAFGCENGEADDFYKAADILNEESEAFKTALSENLKNGESYVKSYCEAFKQCGGNENLLASPNNILAVEYVKALRRLRTPVEILPVKRIGADYNDDKLQGNYSSASGIRANPCDPAVKDNMPLCSYGDFIATKDNSKRFEQLAADVLYTCDKSDLKRVYGCTEGLENRLKALSFGNGYDDIVAQATSKRYSKSRIKRILAANLLGLYSDDTESFLKADLGYKILAVKKERADEIMPILSVQCNQSEEAQKCAELSSRVYNLWRYLNSPLIYDNPNEKMILV